MTGFCLTFDAKYAIFERAKFNRRSQEECESVDSFTTSMYCFCEYGVLKEELIRYRIVVGITDTSLLLKLQTNSTLTVNNIYMARQNDAV